MELLNDTIARAARLVQVDEGRESTAAKVEVEIVARIIRRVLVVVAVLAVAVAGRPELPEHSKDGEMASLFAPQRC